MLSQLKDIGETVQTIVGDDPALHGGLFLLGAVGAAATVLSLGARGWNWVRSRPVPEPEKVRPPEPEKRVKVDIDAPEGTAIDLRVNGN